MEIGKRLNGVDGLPGNRFDIQNLQTVLFRDRNLAAELVLDDLLRACRTKAVQGDSDLRDGCTALGKWDRRSNLESRAAPLFREFWMRAHVIPNVYAIAFNPADPVNTPRGLRMQDATVNTAVLKALKDAVGAMRKAGFALDAPLGEVQAAKSPNGLIPLHGGEEYEGVLNKLQSQPVSADGLKVFFERAMCRPWVSMPRAGGAGAAGLRPVDRPGFAPCLGPDAAVLGQALDFAAVLGAGHRGGSATERHQAE
jgi:acyl-homoserine-lactone acylase